MNKLPHCRSPLITFPNILHFPARKVSQLFLPNLHSLQLDKDPGHSNSLYDFVQARQIEDPDMRLTSLFPILLQKNCRFVGSGRIRLKSIGDRSTVKIQIRRRRSRFPSCRYRIGPYCGNNNLQVWNLPNQSFDIRKQRCRYRI